MHRMITTAVLLATCSVVSADERAILRERRPLDPNSPDIVGEFHQVGLPKYTDLEKRVIARAQKMQDEHTAIFGRIEIGKSIFDYAGLISLGAIRYDAQAKIPYSLTIGIRPHIPEFAGAFCEYHITFDDKGIVRSKAEVASALRTTEK